jgi:hypothetical protein
MSIKLRINGNKTIEHDKIKSKLGLTDKKNHNVFYFEGGAFITPKDEFDYDEVINSIETSCKRSIKKKLINSKTLDTNFLMNFEVCSDRMKKNKNTYLSFQYHFKQKNNENKSIFTVKKENYDFFKSLLSDIETEMNLHNIEINKNKRV